MKNRIISAALVLVLIASMCLTGCASEEETAVKVVPMEKEESNAFSFNFIGGKDVMPIGVFDGPHVSAWNQDGNMGPDFITDEYYQMIKDAGINLIAESKANWMTSRDSLIRSLNLAEKYGIGVLVGDNNITWNYDITEEEANTFVSEYYNYPAFCGLTLLDEPNVPFYNPDGNANRNLDLFVNMAKVLQEDLGVFSKINLYNMGAGWDAKAREIYTKYVDYCFEQLNPSVYCYDMYPHSTSGRTYLVNGILWNMALFRDRALKAGKPYWTYLAAGGQWGIETEDATKKPYFPNEPQFNWYVNAQLAFGCKGFIYYMCFPELKSTTNVSTNWDHYEKGLFGEFGNKTQWYYYAQNANRHIAAIDEVMMNSVSKGIIASSEAVKNEMQFIDCVIESGTFQELQSVSGDAMIGCFNYNGKTALYVVNFSMEYAQKIDLGFNTKHQMMVVQNAETSYVECDTLTLDMAAGEGILVVIE